MSRVPGILGGASVAALVGTVLLVLTPLAGAATTPPFVATPSYAPYGGNHYVGALVTAAVGPGSNKVPVPPTFYVATGVDRQAQRSVATTSGKYGLIVYSGVQNVSFSCGAANCSGNATVTVNWTATWHAILNSSCPGTASAPTVVASVALAIVAEVIEWTTVPSTVVGHKDVIVYHKTLFSSGGVSVGMSLAPYVLTFPATLVAGDSYTVQSWVVVATLAVGVSPAGTACSSWASGSFGATGTTRLNSIAVS